MRALELSAVLLLSASTASAQTTLFELKSGEPDDGFGTSIANVGDVDGDGFADLGVGAARSDLGGVDAGAAYVYSGRTGLRIHRFLGTTGNLLATSLCAAGDVDVDGFADVLIGVPGSGKGRARIYSGRTGDVLRTHEGLSGGDGFGTSVGNVGDVDADGFDDLAANAAPKPWFDYARVFSGKTGVMLANHSSELFHNDFGRAFLGVGDFDGDGFGDYAIGEPLDTGDGFDSGDSAMWMYSGKTDLILFGLDGAATKTDLFGWALASPGDLDGDGKSDVWLGAPGDGYARLYGGVTGRRIVQEHHGRGFFGTAVGCADVDGDGRRDLLASAPLWDSPSQTGVGFVEIFSSTNGSTLLKLEGSLPFEYMGSSLAALGDLTGDGLEEFAVGAFSGYVRVVSPIDLELSSTNLHPLVSTSTGEVVDFELDAGSAFPAQFYLLLGSASGSSPGVPLAPGVDLPLVPDWYTLAILQSLGSPVIDGFFGALDSSGNGHASLDLAAGVDPSLIGTTLYHAFLVFGPTGSAVFASNAAASVLVPDPQEVPTCSFPAPPFEHPGTELVFDGSAAVDPNGSSLVHTWDFGDGNPAPGVVVTHSFPSPGIYEVKHRVEDEDGNASTCMLAVGVDVPNVPAACGFTAAPLFGGWSFDASGSVDADGTVEFYVWDFGDGASLVTDVPQAFYGFSRPGTFTVTMTITDDDEATSTCSQNIVVLPNVPPTCAFEFAQFFGGWRFDASGSDDDGLVELYAWDFGDGMTLETDFPEVFHDYFVAGTFTVTLTVTDDDGATSSCFQVVVEP